MPTIPQLPKRNHSEQPPSHPHQPLLPSPLASPSIHISITFHLQQPLLQSTSASPSIHIRFLAPASAFSRPHQPSRNHVNLLATASQPREPPRSHISLSAARTDTHTLSYASSRQHPFGYPAGKPWRGDLEAMRSDGGRKQQSVQGKDSGSGSGEEERETGAAEQVSKEIERKPVPCMKDSSCC